MKRARQVSAVQSLLFYCKRGSDRSNEVNYTLQAKQSRYQEAHADLAILEWHLMTLSVVKAGLTPFQGRIENKHRSCRSKSLAANR